MENTERDEAQTAFPQNDWQYAENDISVYAAATNDPDPKEEEEDNEEEEDTAGDWGHVDPAEGNGPFPDPNAPSSPGSAV